tara:strand:- start:647 stop:1501 length:855 start_codon:yes stop_codon:yes gene_type:complete
MGFSNLKQIRPILLTGKIGTGKSTKAKTFVNDPVVFYANDIDYDIGSIPIENGIIIEDAHYKPDKTAILSILRTYRGQIVITSINEKSIPKEIKSMCQIKRAGSKNYLAEQMHEIAPRSEKPFSYERDTFSLVSDYLRMRDRDLVRELLHFNKPSDTQILTWLTENLHPNRLLFVDGVVRRRWKQSYFYDILAYTHMGGTSGRMNMPTRGTYSKKPYLARKLGVREVKVFEQLLKDEAFKEWARSKLNNADSRLFRLGEKKKRKKLDPIKIEQTTLFQFTGENK